MSRTGTGSPDAPTDRIPRPGKKRVLPEMALGAPALASFEDVALVLAWTGTDRRLNVARSPDGRSFLGKITLDETSLDGPALTCGSGLTYRAWTGTRYPNHLNILSSPDLQDFRNIASTPEVRFGGRVTLDNTSPYGPALAFGNGRVYVAWASPGASRTLNVASSGDGVHFTGEVELEEEAGGAPELAFMDGNLYVTWCGTDRSLNIMESPDGVSFGNKTTLSDGSDAHPTLARSSSGSFCLFCFGRDQERRLNILVGRTVRDLDSGMRYNESSAAAPAVAEFRGLLHLG
ncbi:MAG: hypothetical protein M3P51_01195 [Chloroflexota bacterium]|nr:hypothetical protein [Chloroflexota bacterium]